MGLEGVLTLHLVEVHDITLHLGCGLFFEIFLKDWNFGETDGQNRSTRNRNKLFAMRCLVSYAAHFYEVVWSVLHLLFYIQIVCQSAMWLQTCAVIES